MSRGWLEGSELERVSQEIPKLSYFQEKVIDLSPDFISISFAPESNIPEASVCLQDAVHTFREARYALYEVFAHKVWYLEKKDPPDEKTAIFFRRFYIDDAALRLYSAGEHLANGIINMLEIKYSDLKDFKKIGRANKRLSEISFLRKDRLIL